MTTAHPKAQQQAPPETRPGYRITSVGSVVRAAFVGTLAAGALVTIVAALVSGSPAALGAGIAVAIVSLFFVSGALVIYLATLLAPATSLLIALLTYMSKVVLIGLVFLSLDGSGTLDGPVDARWLGGTVIVCTLAWMTTQIVFSMRARQLAYDLPPKPKQPPQPTEASVR